jgi:hypothetical protein
MKSKYIKLGISIVTSLYFLSYINSVKDLDGWVVLDSVNLIFHEAGHTIFFFMGDFLQALAGSAFQIFIPCVLTLYFSVFRKEHFSASLLLFWVGQNIINVSIYMSDAVTQTLPLLGGEAVIHDWNYIFSILGLLSYTSTISFIVYNIGIWTIVVACVLCFYFSYKSDIIIE